MVVPVAELKTLSIALGVAAKALDALHRMDTQRRVVRPENVARLADQDDAFRAARHDLAEATEIDRLGAERGQARFPNRFLDPGVRTEETTSELPPLMRSTHADI